MRSGPPRTDIKCTLYTTQEWDPIPGVLRITDMRADGQGWRIELAGVPGRDVMVARVNDEGAAQICAALTEGKGDR